LGFFFPPEEILLENDDEEEGVLALLLLLLSDRLSISVTSRGVAYSKLLFCPPLIPLIPPDDLPLIFVVRGVADVDAAATT